MFLSSLIPACPVWPCMHKTSAHYRRQVKREIPPHVFVQGLYNSLQELYLPTLRKHTYPAFFFTSYLGSGGSRSRSLSRMRSSRLYSEIS